MLARDLCRPRSCERVPVDRRDSASGRATCRNMTGGSGGGGGGRGKAGCAEHPNKRKLHSSDLPLSTHEARAARTGDEDRITAPGLRSKLASSSPPAACSWASSQPAASRNARCPMRLFRWRARKTRGAQRVQGSSGRAQAAVRKIVAAEEKHPCKKVNGSGGGGCLSLPCGPLGSSPSVACPTTCRAVEVTPEAWGCSK